MGAGAKGPQGINPQQPPPQPGQGYGGVPGMLPPDSPLNPMNNQGGGQAGGQMQPVQPAPNYNLPGYKYGAIHKTTTHDVPQGPAEPPPGAEQQVERRAVMPQQPAPQERTVQYKGNPSNMGYQQDVPYEGGGQQSWQTTEQPQMPPRYQQPAPPPAPMPKPASAQKPVMPNQTGGQLPPGYMPRKAPPTPMPQPQRKMYGVTKGGGQYQGGGQQYRQTGTQTQSGPQQVDMKSQGVAQPGQAQAQDQQFQDTYQKQMKKKAY